MTKKELKKYIGKRIEFKHTRCRVTIYPRTGVLKEIIRNEAYIEDDYYSISGLYDIKIR